MKLREEDKALLLSWGYEKQDLPQIEEALKGRITVYKLDNRPISREKVIEILGMRDFLSGIARSAFHWTAARETAEGQVVLFDSRRLFK